MLSHVTQSVKTLGNKEGEINDYGSFNEFAYSQRQGQHEVGGFNISSLVFGLLHNRKNSSWK